MEPTMTFPPATPSQNVPVVQMTPPQVKKPRRFRLALAVLLSSVALVVGAYVFYRIVNNGATAPKPHLKIGVMVAFSGGSSSMGYGEIKGIQLAKKELSADTIDLVQVDSRCDPSIAPEVIKKLIDQKVVAIIGDGCSSVSAAALPFANKAKIPMVSPSASSPSLSIPGDYFFRVVPPDNFQGAFMAKTIYDKGLRHVAVFYTNESYGLGISKVFKDKFTSLGGQVVIMTSAEPDLIQLDSQIAAIKAAKPDAIYFAPNATVSAIAAIKLASAAGLNVPYYGGDVLYDKTVISNVGNAAEGLIMTSFPIGSKTFKQAIYNEYQSTDLLYGAPQAYDAFSAIYKTIQDGATTGEEIKDKLPSVSFTGVSAKITFDKNGEISDPNYKYDLLTVKDGEIVPLNN